MTKVVLTGVAGFIGAHTLKHFLEATDWEIVGIDSLEHHGDYRRIEQILEDSDPKEKARFTFIKQDLAKIDAKEFAKKLGKVEHIINMAAESHVDRSINDPVPFVKNNVDLCVNMLEVARLTKPQSFIQISTDEVYGPMYDYAYKEWDPQVPSNPYSASKAAQEMLAISYWRTYGVPLVITNTMNNIGEMQDIEKFLPLLVDSISKGKAAKVHAVGDEIGSRFYLHARNHADALLYIINNLPVHAYDPDKGVVKPDRYHVVGDTRLNNLELAEKVAEILEMPLKYKFVDSHTARPGHDMHYGLDGAKLTNLGWKPPVPFDEALRKTIQHYLDHPEWLSWELGLDEEDKPTKAKAKPAAKAAK